MNVTGTCLAHTHGRWNALIYPYFTLHLSTVIILNYIASMIQVVLLISGWDSFRNVFKGEQE